MRLADALTLRSKISAMARVRTNEPADSAKQLDRWRREIDSVDEIILQALELRGRAVQEIGKYKREHGLPVLDEARERLILDRVMDKTSSLPNELRGEIFSIIINRMREWESTLD